MVVRGDIIQDLSMNPPVRIVVQVPKTLCDRALIVAATQRRGAGWPLQGCGQRNPALREARGLRKGKFLLRSCPGGRSEAILGGADAERRVAGHHLFDLQVSLAAIFPAVEL